MLHSLSIPKLSSFSPTKTPNPYSLSPSPSPHPPRYLKFRTTHLENLRYLKAIGIIDPNTKPQKLPSPDNVEQILATINFFKSKGITDPEFSRLAFLCPQLFSTTFEPTDIEPVFEFLSFELHASVKETCGLILNCPNILFSDVVYCLRPTLNYLRQLGVEKLNVPSKTNAHLLNTRVEKLRKHIRFLRSTGLTYEEAARVCVRLPAIFGYSIDNNLRPKYEYLVREMERSLEELKEFPQYFGFSMKKRIEPRHLHLKQRNVRIKLNRMLLWSDNRFYSKWK